MIYIFLLLNLLPEILASNWFLLKDDLDVKTLTIMDTCVRTTKYTSFNSTHILSHKYNENGCRTEKSTEYKEGKVITEEEKNDYIKSNGYYYGEISLSCNEEPAQLYVITKQGCNKFKTSDGKSEAPIYYTHSDNYVIKCSYPTLNDIKSDTCTSDLMERCEKYKDGVCVSNNVVANTWYINYEKNNCMALGIILLFGWLLLLF